jgi:hypothetical protein
MPWSPNYARWPLWAFRLMGIATVAVGIAIILGAVGDMAATRPDGARAPAGTRGQRLAR